MPKPCILDANQLLEGQYGIDYGNMFVAVNPFPILPNHLTIIDREHTPQELDRVITPALNLAHDLEEEFLVFYNGAKVGATVPDHAHLQAGSRSNLPIEYDMLLRKGEPAYEDRDTEIYLPNGLGRTVVVIEGRDQTRLEAIVGAFMDRLPNDENEREPRVNAVFTFDKDHWTVYMFPRTEFKPQRSQLNESDPRYLKLGPAALEMAGIIVTTNEDDFVRISDGDVTEVYSEVSMDRSIVAAALKIA